MGRLGELFRKSRSALTSGTLSGRARRYLASQTRSIIQPLVGYTRLNSADRALEIGSGFADHRADGNRSADPEHLRRIIAAYKLSKQAEARVSPAFRIRGIWAEWLQVHYGPLIRAVESGDVSALARLLENHYRESFTSGTGGYDTLLRYHRPLGSLYIRHVWTAYRDTLSKVGYDISDLSFPTVGNPVGVWCNGSVVSIETLRHAYHAHVMTGLLRGIDAAVVVEIGGGLGGQCYQAVRLGGIGRYTIYDIPEVALVSSFFLLSAFPEQQVRLFGEHRDSQLAVLPHFDITQLREGSVDLFFNSCSFSEMDRDCSTEYLAVIERACRGFFLHDNHETRLTFRYSDGTTSVNRVGSEMVPDPTRFRLKFKRPRAHGLPEDHGFAHFEYLYERVG